MNRNRTCGFTLVELMIAVAIVGILSAIATSYYGRYVISSNRTDARAALNATATSLEKCKSLYATYGSANCNVTFPVTSNDGYYTVTTTALPATTFTLTASPVAGRTQANDTECTSLTLTNTGIEGGTGTKPAECW